MVGPGRGSAAGSIVAYTLAITNIDPIRYQLLFERFLNPERVSMPDIDVDFCFERRQEVIDYVVRKYGKDRVVQIVTFGTLQARGVLRDVGRVMDLPYAFVDSIAKMIPKELNITLDKSLKMNHELKKLYDEDPQVKELIDMSKRLEGLPRHTSMHAAGVVISQKDVDEYVPLALGADNNVVTQFTMTTLEELGLLKMDFQMCIRDRVYVPIEETKTEGVMVLDGSLGYIGRAEEPTRILFKGGRITEIEETPTGIRLKKYMEDYQDPRIYIAGELGIGLNSCSQCLGNCYIEDESAYGTFHVGLGRNIALGGIQNAKGHFDLVCMEPDIYTDNRQIMQQGKVIIPEPVLY